MSKRTSLIALAISTLINLRCGGSTGDASSTTVCTGPFAELSAGCPASYDGTPTNLPPCFASTYRYVFAQACHGLIAVIFSNMVTGQECFYDATTHELVGASLFTDD